MNLVFCGVFILFLFIIHRCATAVFARGGKYDQFFWATIAVAEIGRL